MTKRGNRLNCHLIAAFLFVAPALAGGRPQWVSLFDGKTLAGWRVEGQADWKVQDGAIVGRQGAGSTGGDLYTEREWADFELEAEFKMSSPGNSGIWFRRGPAQPGYQIDLIDEAAHPGILSGSLYAMSKGFLAKNSDPGTIRKNGWNRVRLLVVGDGITIVMNGKTVVKTNDSSFLKPGSIGIQVHQGESVRNMEIRIRKMHIRSL